MPLAALMEDTYNNFTDDFMHLHMGEKLFINFSNMMFHVLIVLNALTMRLWPPLCVFVVKEPLDYQGRSFMHVPQDVGVNLRSAEPPAKCFLSKKLIHTWTGHNKGIHAIRWFPSSAHLLLSCSMDSKIKVCFGLTQSILFDRSVVASCYVRTLNTLQVLCN